MALVYRLKERGGEPEGGIYGSRLAGLWRLLIAPYSALSLLSLALSRALSRESAADEVAPGIWVGAIPLPGERRAVLGRGIGAVLNLCFEFPDLAGLRFLGGRAYLWLPILDGVAPGPGQLDEAVAWSLDRRREGKDLLVHCAQGHGRSATVAAALLVRAGVEPTLWDSIARLIRLRPGIRLHQGQVAAAAGHLERAA